MPNQVGKLAISGAQEKNRLNLKPYSEGKKPKQVDALAA